MYLDNQQIEKDGEVISGSWVPERAENDALTAALGNPEHSGRTRGVGHLVGWKKGLQLEGKRKRRKSRNDELIQEIKSQMEDDYKQQRQRDQEENRERFQMLELEIAYLKSQRQAEAPETGSPGIRKSSCASACDPDCLDDLQVMYIYP